MVDALGRHRPAGQGGDFLHRAVLNLQQSDDEPRGGRELGQHALDQFARGGGMIAGIGWIGRKTLQPVGFFIRKIRERHFPVAPVGAQKIVAGAHGQPHEPMFEGRVAAKAAQFLKRLKENFLDNVLDFAFAAGVTAGGGEDARLIFLHQRLKAGSVAVEHGCNQLRIGASHSHGIWHNCPGRESGKPPRERGGLPVNPT